MDRKDSSEHTNSDWSSCHERRGMCGPLSWSILPIVLSITSLTGFIATYLMAKSNCHIEKWMLPYLSYTGTEYPESMIFGMILNTEGFLGLIVVFLAWRYYRHMAQRGCLNTLTLVLGFLSCFGVIMVGNFQVTKAKIPHYIGASLAFIVGTAYGILTAVLSRRAFRVAEPPLKYGNCISVIRWVIAMLMVIAVVCLCGIATYKSLNKREKSEKNGLFTNFVHPNGSCIEILSSLPISSRYNDLIGSVTEWLLTVCLLVSLSLFAYEFKTFQNVKVVLLRHDGPLRGGSGSNRGFSYDNRNSSSLSAQPFLTPTLHHYSAPSFSRSVYTKSNFTNVPRIHFYNSRQEGKEFLVSSLTATDGTLDGYGHNATADSGIEDSSTVSTEQSPLYLPIKKLSQARSLPNIAAVV